MTVITSRRPAKILLAAAVLTFLVAGCSNKQQQQQFNDAPRTATQNNSPAEVIAMPDGFNNAASKCDGPNRVYVLFHNDSAYGGIAVVPNDPRCTGANPAVR